MVSHKLCESSDELVTACAACTSCLFDATLLVLDTVLVEQEGRYVARSLARSMECLGTNHEFKRTSLRMLGDELGECDFLVCSQVKKMRRSWMVVCARVNEMYTMFEFEEALTCWAGRIGASEVAAACTRPRYLQVQAGMADLGTYNDETVRVIA